MGVVKASLNTESLEPIEWANPDESLREYIMREKEYLPDCVKYSKALPNPFITIGE